MKTGGVLVLSVLLVITVSCRADEDAAPVVGSDDQSPTGAAAPDVVAAAQGNTDSQPTEAKPILQVSENPEEAHQQLLHHIAHTQFGHGPALPPHPYLLPPYVHYPNGVPFLPFFPPFMPPQGHIPQFANNHHGAHAHGHEGIGTTAGTTTGTTTDTVQSGNVEGASDSGVPTSPNASNDADKPAESN